MLKGSGPFLGFANRAALVEHDPPPAVRFVAPDRCECTDQLALRIMHRSAGQRERAGAEHFHDLGLPREGRILGLEETLPGFDHRSPPAKRALSAEENPFLRDVTRKGLEVAGRHRLGEGALRRANLGGQIALRAWRQADDDRIAKGQQSENKSLHAISSCNTPVGALSVRARARTPPTLSCHRNTPM